MALYIRYIYGKDQRIDFYYPLKDPQNSLELSAYHALFRDYWLSGDGKIVRYRDLIDDFKLDEYRFMVRGLRWLSANMLTWGDKGFLMPEQLDNPSLVRRLSKK